MKLSLFTAALLLTGSLYASDAHKISPTKEGLIAVKLFDTALTMTLAHQIKAKNDAMTKMQMCTTAADATMKKMNTELPAHVVMSIASLEGNSTTSTTDIEILKKYKEDIKNKTQGAMLMRTATVENGIRVYKPLLIDDLWIECYEDKSTVKVGDFKGLIVSEVSKH